MSHEISRSLRLHIRWLISTIPGASGAGAEVPGLKTVEGLQLYIDPEECIDCGACEPECPVDAIYDEDDLPEEYEKYTEINANFFEE